MAISEEGATWQPAVAIALPANAAVAPRKGLLERVSCSAPGYCAAVGVYQDSQGEFEPMAASEIAGSWQAATEITLPGNEPGQHSRSQPLFDSLSCSGPDDCAAVGNYAKGGLEEFYGMYATSSNGNWQPQATRVQFPQGFSETKNHLAAVSCWAPGSCSAVGSYPAAGGDRAMVLTENNGAWSTAAEAPLPVGVRVEKDSFESVSCFGPGDCEASGALLEGTSAYGMAAGERNGVWQQGVELAPPPDSERELSVSVDQIACGSELLCAATGFRDVEESWVAAFTNGQWGALQLLVLPGAPAPAHSKIYGVACASTRCAAVGEYEGADKHHQMMLASASEYGWDTAASVIALPAETYGSLQSVSCSPAGNCDAVGGLVTGSGRPRLPMVLSSGEPPPAPSAAPQASTGGGSAPRTSSLAVIASARIAGLLLKLLAPTQCTAPGTPLSLRLSASNATRHPSHYKISHVAFYIDGGAKRKVRAKGRHWHTVHGPQFQSSRSLTYTFLPSTLSLHRGAHKVLVVVTLRRVQTIHRRRVVHTITKRLAGTFHVC